MNNLLSGVSYSPWCSVSIYVSLLEVLPKGKSVLSMFLQPLHGRSFKKSSSINSLWWGWDLHPQCQLRPKVFAPALARYAINSRVFMFRHPTKLNIFFFAPFARVKILGALKANVFTGIRDFVATLAAFNILFIFTHFLVDLGSKGSVRFR